MLQKDIKFDSQDGFFSFRLVILIFSQNDLSDQKFKVELKPLTFETVEVSQR